MIHYFMTWGENDLDRQLVYSPAGINKAKYIVSKLQQLDNVVVASFAYAKQSFNGIYLPKRVVHDGIGIRYCATFGSRFILFRLLERYLNIIQMYLYILLSTKKGDILFFYNERYYASPIRFAHNILHRNVVIEVEELNTIAAGYKQEEIQKEIEDQKNADGYILVNSVLKEYLPFVLDKPHCELYGAYNSIDIKYEKFDDGKIHVLYSGTFNKAKGGAIAAVNMVSALSDRFQIHITGFGNQSEISEIERAIDDLDCLYRSRITYHGFISLTELDILMQQCHIGLCTQDPTTQLNLTSFPSKILNYMAHGLIVVSGRNKAIETSDVGDLICYYSEQTPESMAHTLESINDYSGKKCIDRLELLDKQTATNLSMVISNLK